MRKLLFICCLAFIFCDCQKVFKEDDQNKLLIDTKDDLAFAIAGLQNRFTYSVMNTYNLCFLNSDELAIGESMGDGSLGGFKYGKSSSWCFHENININKPYSIILLWQDLYQNVASANSIFQKSSDLIKDDPDATQMLGEVYFLRAFTYFRLVRYFGEVPIIDNLVVSFNIKKSSYLEVYNFIISDLEKAIRLLPPSNNQARIKNVTPYKGTAQALLAEVYLAMGGYPLKQPEMYAKAAAVAEDIIGNSDKLGYGLLPDMDDLWKFENRLNSESQFALFFSDYNSDTLETYNKTYQRIGYLSHSQDYYSNGFYDLATTMRVGPRFYYNFQDSYRKIVTFMYLGDVYFSNTLFPSRDPLPKKIDQCTLILLRKNYNPSNNSVRNFHEGRIIYLMRFAHTLLTYAEAKARSGNTDASAYEAVNQVRRRAHHVDLNEISVFDLQPGLTNEQFADSVVWEKAMEFCAEPEHRMFDLLRLEKYKLLKALRSENYQLNFEAECVDPNTNFFPIPEMDKKLNPNLN
jgi:hypothetical protein